MRQTRRDFLKRFLGASGALCAPLRCHAADVSEVGKVYDGWREGEFDVHLIHTGRGEAIFHVFPDGTSMLIDAGDSKSKEKAIPPHPDDSRRAGEWVARYIQRVNPLGTDVDYMMLSHYHPDHGGRPQKGVETAVGRGDYAISGLAQVAEFVHFDAAFDRGYPDYETPVPVAENQTADNFRRFAAWAVKEKGMTMEKFEPGRLDQIRLQKKDAYDFHVRNLSANGIVWTGVGSDTHNFLADYGESVAKENPLSLSMTIQYGPFRYYTGGDLDTSILGADGGPVPIEAAVGRAAGPVDVVKVNHHGNLNASTDEFVRSVQARAYLCTVWTMNQPSNDSIGRVMSPENYVGPRDYFPTLPCEKRSEGLLEGSWREHLALDGGHVVLKVFDGGARFKIFYLTADDESMRVKAVYGPFESTGTQRYCARQA
ncbi:MAG: hypothetical protein J6S40_06715 [Thermoguttaceae bacterium]|nr:hypothetical protein [Thermoguttaceae bacterium]